MRQAETQWDHQPRVELRPNRGGRGRSEARLVEWSPFPRSRPDQHWQVGFARRLSTSAMRLDVEHGVPVGSLLRVLLRDADGRPTLDAVTRVDWALQGEQTRVTVGLSVLARARRGPARLAPSPG
jgi:hypothetical protein